MKKGVEIYLQDIMDSSALIEKRLKNVTQEKFEDDIDIQDMIVHRLEIIGEAVKNIPKEFRDAHSEVLWHRPAGMRDKLIHHYDSIDLTVVWDTINEGLPPLVKEIKKLLEEMKVKPE
jgi:uncharacterized protein with HEPN domain